jgi:prepilin-type N-terminal cleavage/methylation domain-containing protein
MTIVPAHLPSIARRGLTLLEIILSLVILSVVMLAAQSAIMVAAKAMPTNRSVSETTSRAANVIDQLATDLRYAKTVSTMTERVIEFTVPDRTGDGQPETIRYEWDGTTGTALARKINGNDPVVLSPAVHFFRLEYDIITTDGGTVLVEGPETIIASYDVTSSLNNATVSSSNWRAQHFNPNLPGNAVSWRATRVYVKARIKGSSQGETRIQIRPAIAGKPSNVVLAETTLYENTLTSSYSWKEIVLVQNVQLGPLVTACLVLQWDKDAESCDVQFKGSLLFGEPVYCMLSGSDNSWNQSNDVLLYYVLGRVTAPAPGGTTYNLAAVRCTFQAPHANSPAFTTTIRVIEQPQVSGP